MWHQGVPGLPPVPADQDLIVQEGCSDGDDGLTCGAADTHAIAINSLSRATLENLNVTGKIANGTMSLMSAKDSEINGEIINHKHAGVDLGTDISGNGMLTCVQGAFAIDPTRVILCGDSWL